VEFDSSVRDVEPCGDLLSRKPFDKQSENLALAQSQHRDWVLSLRGALRHRLQYLPRESGSYSVEERTTPLMLAGTSPFQFGPTIR
jgi:hypothetical protein